MAKNKKETFDNLASSLVEGLNTEFQSKTNQAACLLGDPALLSEVTEWVPTGCTALDLAISNRPNGGWPVGRIVEITGLEASGKSLLAAHALAETQKKGGIAIYIDTEASMARDFFNAIGVDEEKLLLVQLNALEDIFEAIEYFVNKIRSTNKDVLTTIVVDSVMGAVTQSELESDYGKDGYATDKAIIISKAMRKLTVPIAKEKILLVFTNQLRTKMGVSFGDPYTTSGGKALAFHSSVRLRLKQMGQIKVPLNGVQQAVGIKTRASVIKNRLGPPLKSVDYDIYFDSGIDDAGSWLTIMKTYKLVKTGGAWYTYTAADKLDIINPETGEVSKQSEVKFKSKDFASILEANPALKAQIYDRLCDLMVMKYKVNKDYGIDDITVDEEFVNEES